jgi:hypothetical protein
VTQCAKTAAVKTLEKSINRNRRVVVRKLGRPSRSESVPVEPSNPLVVSTAKYYEALKKLAQE